MKSRSIAVEGPADMRLYAATTINGHFNTASKYDLGRTVAGQAVGGPDHKPKISMWDMMTLYDTQKKKVEDREAYLTHKK
jgi:hypothetical protein